MNARLPYRVLQGIVIGLAVPTIAMGAAISASEYRAAKEHAAADFKTAKAQCKGLTGNAKDVCIAEAKATEKKAKTEAEAQYRNTDKAQRDARIGAAEADYDVAKAKCGAKSGNEKDVCIAEAKAVETKAIADVKATQKIAAARQDARAEKLDAEYKVAIEKCDAMSDPAKESCVNAAKAKYRR
jgi:hypothetical protein